VTVRGCACKQPFDVRDRDARGAPTAQKRAIQPRALDRTKAFGKDWIRLSHSGRYDMNRLKETTLLLVARDGPLGPEWLDQTPTARGVD
jgi:mRNA interferase YafQ